MTIDLQSIKLLCNCVSLTPSYYSVRQCLIKNCLFLKKYEYERLIEIEISLGDIISERRVTLLFQNNPRMLF